MIAVSLPLWAPSLGTLRFPEIFFDTSKFPLLFQAMHWCVSMNDSSSLFFTGQHRHLTVHIVKTSSYTQAFAESQLMHRSRKLFLSVTYKGLCWLSWNSAVFKVMCVHAFLKTGTLVWRSFISNLVQMFCIQCVKLQLQRLVLTKSSKHVVFPGCLHIMQTQLKSPGPEFSSIPRKKLSLRNTLASKLIL